MKSIILTLFPDMFPGTLGYSLAGKGMEKDAWAYETINIRDFAMDKHKTVDDKSYGGGTGLVMKPDVVGAAIEAAKAKLPSAKLIYPTPRGTPLTQGLVQALAKEDMIILCGRYEGVDQRILDHYQPLEVSLGDYVLSGGEIAAQVLLDACIRLIPGVISKEEALESESFNTSGISAGLLEYPQYTAPPCWKGMNVPDVLVSGHHQMVADWRLEKAKEITQARRKDLWDAYVKKQG